MTRKFLQAWIENGVDDLPQENILRHFCLNVIKKVNNIC